MSSKRRPRRGAALAALLAGVLTSGLGGFPALVAGAAAAAAAPACHPGYDGLPGEAEHPYACRYLDATMPDGTTIAVVVSLPVGFRADRPYPALFMMDGYDGGGGALDPNSYGNRFVMVHASIRGTGCSGGQFDLFSWHDAEDGADLVEHWIPGQSWSDGRVGIIGHSYPGLTGFMVAERVGYDHALQPSSTEHLTGVAVSGLIDDVYRGITYMGGIPDFGFPLAWDGALRPAQEDVGNFDRYRAEAEAGDTGCVHALVTRQESDVLDPSLVADDPIVNGVLEQQDGPWWVVHSLITYAGYLDVPIHVDQQYQDEQTGPRGGAVLFEALEHLKPTLPMRIVLGNGRHDSAGHVYHADEQAWLDCFVAKLDGDCRRLGAEKLPEENHSTYASRVGGAATGSAAILTDRTPLPCRGDRVVGYFETVAARPGSNGTNPPVCSSTFPADGTRWTRWYLRGDGTLGPRAGPGASRSYLSTGIGPDDYVGPTEEDPLDQASDAVYRGAAGPVLASSGPEELAWQLPIHREATIFGPMMVTLDAGITGIDTDFFVQLIDRDDATGEEQYLQYGLLQASYAGGLERNLSAYVAAHGRRGPMYRPYYSYSNPVPVTPGRHALYRIEVFPLGWVLRPGHTLIVTVSAPPGFDQLYGWGGAERPPATTTIYEGGGQASSILIPLLPSSDNPLVGREPACGDQEGVRCVKPLMR